MKMIRFATTWFETDATGTSRARFEAGKDYPSDDAEAQRCVVRGIAEEVDVPDEVAADDAADTAATPKAKASKAKA